MAVTPEANWRYADGVVSSDGNRLISIREDHTQAGREAVNTIVSIDLSGDRGQRVLVEGADFYSNPRLSPDGSKIAFTSNRAGSWDIFVMPIAGGRPLQITADPAHEVHPSWSPRDWETRPRSPSPPGRQPRRRHSAGRCGRWCCRSSRPRWCR